MSAVDIAFVTSGDSRSPEAQPLSGRTSRGASQGRIPYSTISNVYEAYARRLVREGSNVFRVPNSREAQRQIVRWTSQHPDDHVRNVYFIGHANRFFSWRVRLGSDRNTLAPSNADDQLRPHVAHYHQSGPRIRQDVHYGFLRDLARSMGTGRDTHVVEFRACAMAETTLVDTGVLMLFAAARGWRFPDLRVEFRGYRDFCSILPNSNGGFRTVIERVSDGHVVAQAPGMGAPRPQLLACLSNAQVAAGDLCR